MAYIKVTPDKMMETSKKLKSMGIDLNRILTEYELIINELDLQCSGETQDLFNKKACQAISDMRNFIKFCDGYSNLLIDTVEVYRQEEENMANNLYDSFSNSTIF